MKYFLFFFTLSMASCTWTPEEYKEQYFNSKPRYIKAKNDIRKLLLESDTLYKYEVLYTGKRLVESSYVSDNKEYYLDSLKLDHKQRSFFNDFMYSENLEYVVVYGDSAKYFYSKLRRGVIVIYEKGSVPIHPQGELIDSNVYLYFREPL